MTVTYGFYNSVGGDRKYNSTQLSSIFNGLINDGIFMSIGTALAPAVSTGMNVNVGVGRAWFNGTWLDNDAILQLSFDQSETILHRIDSIVLEFDSSDNVRANSIKVVKGTPASNPVHPTLTDTSTKHSYRLADVRIDALVTSIAANKITSYVGTGSVPYVTGILDTVDVDALLVQWDAEWDVWVATHTADFEDWFDAMKDQLTTDAAGNLQTQINVVNTTLDTLDFHAKTSKTTPVNNDELPLLDSAASYGPKKLTIANLDTHTRTLFPTKTPGVRVYRAGTAINFTSGVATLLTFDTVADTKTHNSDGSDNTDSCWSNSNGERLVAKTAGWYMCGASLGFTSYTSAFRMAIIAHLLNSAGTIDINLGQNETYPLANVNTYTTLTIGMFYMHVNDYVVFYGYQSSGVTKSNQVATSTGQNGCCGWLMMCMREF